MKILYVGLFNFGKKEINKLSEEIQELKKLAAGSRGFDNIALSNVVANLNSALTVWPKWDINSNIQRYADTDDIYSIIRLLATNAAGIPLYGYYKTPDKKSLSTLIREFKYDNPYKHKKIQTKALTDLPEQDVVAELLENPHEDMSKFEFFESVFSFLFLCGEVFLLKERPDDGPNKGKTIQLNIMFPQGVTLKVTDTLPRKVVGYDYRVAGQLIYENIPADDVIHIKYWNPENSFLGEELRGVSPLKAFKKKLTRLQKSMDTSVSQITNGGVKTIVYDEGTDNAVDSTGVEVSVAGSRKDKFYKFSSNPANAGAPFFASGKMGVIQIGSTLTDMGLLELGKVDKKDLANLYGLSDRLLNNDATGSEISDLGARKGMYVNVLIPNVRRVRDALVKGLLPDFQFGVVLEGPEGEADRVPGDGKERYIDLDISGITELHEDIAKKVAQYANLPIMIPNMILEEMGFPTVEDDELMNKVYIKAGYTPIDDMQPIDPIDITTPNGN